MKKEPRKICPSDLILNIVKYVFIFGFTILCIYPFYYVIICSISDAQSVSKGIFLLPRGITFETYLELFQRDDLWNMGLSVPGIIGDLRLQQMGAGIPEVFAGHQLIFELRLKSHNRSSRGEQKVIFFERNK